MFDRFKKEEGGEMVEEKPMEEEKVESVEEKSIEEKQGESVEEKFKEESSILEKSSEIGIGELMEKILKKNLLILRI
jgi:hypothetical protein